MAELPSRLRGFSWQGVYPLKKPRLGSQKDPRYQEVVSVFERGRQQLKSRLFCFPLDHRFGRTHGEDTRIVILGPMERGQEQVGSEQEQKDGNEIPREWSAVVVEVLE